VSHCCLFLSFMASVKPPFAAPRGKRASDLVGFRVSIQWCVPLSLVLHSGCTHCHCCSPVSLRPSKRWYQGIVSRAIGDSKIRVHYGASGAFIVKRGRREGGVESLDGGRSHTKEESRHEFPLAPRMLIITMSPSSFLDVFTNR
jgi:hypothetical protein